MKHRVRILAAALVAAFVVGGGLAHAQIANVNIDFAFTAAGKPMPAGKYQVEVTKAGPVVLSGTGVRVSLRVITRLGRHDEDNEPELVFDKFGGVLHLSEVWLPGQDGYLLLGTTEMHDHTILGGPKGKK